MPHLVVGLIGTPHATQIGVAERQTGFIGFHTPHGLLVQRGRSDRRMPHATWLSVAEGQIGVAVEEP